jgi:hypothetical protein
MLGSFLGIYPQQFWNSWFALGFTTHEMPKKIKAKKLFGLV